MTALTLKSIALLTMIIDHVGYLLMGNMLEMRLVGRVAFPIYCFLLVEGYFNTRNLKRYLVRLAAFAVISEIPFDLAIHGTPFSLTSQNIYFELTLGLLAVHLCEQFGEHWLKFPSILGVLLASGFAAELLHFDYGMVGIVYILAIYISRDRGKYVQAGVFSAAAVIASFGSWQMAASFGSLIFTLYSGKKGYSGKAVQYFFYAAYPLHLLIIWIIKAYM